jgi:hypothetical protein
MTRLATPRRRARRYNAIFSVSAVAGKVLILHGRGLGDELHRDLAALHTIESACRSFDEVLEPTGRKFWARRAAAGVCCRAVGLTIKDDLEG